MAKYLFNTTNSIYLFKGGSLEVPPKGHRPVSDTDFNSGIFEDAILTGALKVYNTLEEVPAVDTSYEPAPIEKVNQGVNGASTEELKAFIASKEAKKQAEAERLQAAITPTVSETIPAPTVTPEPDPIPDAPAVPVELKIESTETPVTTPKKTKAPKNADGNS